MRNLILRGKKKIRDRKYKMDESSSSGDSNTTVILVKWNYIIELQRWMIIYKIYWYKIGNICHFCIFYINYDLRIINLNKYKKFYYKKMKVLILNSFI